MFSEVMRYILDLGPTVMLPIVIIIFSKILGMKAGDCFKAGLHIGIGFVGIGLVIGLMRFQKSCVIFSTSALR